MPACIGGVFLGMWAAGAAPSLMHTNSVLGAVQLDVHLEPRLLAFCAALGILTIVLFALGPAISGSTAPLSPVLKASKADMVTESPALSERQINGGCASGAVDGAVDGCDALYADVAEARFTRPWIRTRARAADLDEARADGSRMQSSPDRHVSHGAGSFGVPFPGSNRSPSRATGSLRPRRAAQSRSRGYSEPADTMWTAPIPGSFGPSASRSSTAATSPMPIISRRRQLWRL